jgi:hypothetical protein
VERALTLIFAQWLQASEQLDTSNGSEYSYLLGKVTALTDAYADIEGTTFVHASQILLQRKFVN